MKKTYRTTPGAEQQLAKVMDEALVRRVRHTALPNAKVIEYYPGGQPKTYRVGRRTYTRRQYATAVRKAREQKLIQEVKPEDNGAEIPASDADTDG